MITLMFMSTYVCKHQAKERLLRGEELDESFVMDVILEKLNSQEIKHYGMWNPVFLIGSEVYSKFISISVRTVVLTI